MDEDRISRGTHAAGKVAEMIGHQAERILDYVYRRIINRTSEKINLIIQRLRHAVRGLAAFRIFRTRVLFFPGKLDLNPA